MQNPQCWKFFFLLNINPMGQFHSDSIPGKMPFLGFWNFFLVLVLESGKKLIQNLNPQESNPDLQVSKGYILSLKRINVTLLYLFTFSFLLKKQMPCAVLLLTEFLLSSGTDVGKLWPVGWIPAFINKALLGHSYAHSLTYCVGLLSCCSDRQRWVTVLTETTLPTNPTCLLSGHLQKSV